jgi:hypothetical protein
MRPGPAGGAPPIAPGLGEATAVVSCLVQGRKGRSCACGTARPRARAPCTLANFCARSCFLVGGRCSMGGPAVHWLWQLVGGGWSMTMCPVEGSRQGVGECLHFLAAWRVVPPGRGGIRPAYAIGQSDARLQREVEVEARQARVAADRHAHLCAIDKVRRNVFAWPSSLLVLTAPPPRPAARRRARLNMPHPPLSEPSHCARTSMGSLSRKACARGLARTRGRSRSAVTTRSVLTPTLCACGVHDCAHCSHQPTSVWCTRDLRMVPPPPPEPWQRRTACLPCPVPWCSATRLPVYWQGHLQRRARWKIALTSACCSPSSATSHGGKQTSQPASPTFAFSGVWGGVPLPTHMYTPRAMGALESRASCHVSRTYGCVCACGARPARRAMLQERCAV